MTELPVSVTRMVSRISFTAIKNITNPDEDFKVTKLTVKGMSYAGRPLL